MTLSEPSDFAARVEARKAECWARCGRRKSYLRGHVDPGIRRFVRLLEIWWRIEFWLMWPIRRPFRRFNLHDAWWRVLGGEAVTWRHILGFEDLSKSTPDELEAEYPGCFEREVRREIEDAAERIRCDSNAKDLAHAG